MKKAYHCKHTEPKPTSLLSKTLLGRKPWLMMKKEILISFSHYSFSLTEDRGKRRPQSQTRIKSNFKWKVHLIVRKTEKSSTYITIYVCLIINNYPETTAFYSFIKFYACRILPCFLLSSSQYFFNWASKLNLYIEWSVADNVLSIW